MMAIDAALDSILSTTDEEVEYDRTSWVMTDSQSSITALQQFKAQDALPEKLDTTSGEISNG